MYPDPVEAQGLALPSCPMATLIELNPYFLRSPISPSSPQAIGQSTAIFHFVFVGKTSPTFRYAQLRHLVEGLLLRRGAGVSKCEGDGPTLFAPQVEGTAM